MKKIINGLSVNFTGNPSNRPIIFIHGFPFDHTMWKFQIETLQNDYYCIAYDIRGLGESIIGDGQYTLEFMVDDLFSIISELKLNKPLLCGLSMGGYIALRAIERNQNLFSALILCDTKSEADDNNAKIKRSGGINQINTEGLEKFNKQFITNCFSDVTLEENENLFLDTLNKSNQNKPTGVKGAFIAILTRTDTTEYLSKIKIPTLVICGSFDALTSPSLMRMMAEKIPNSEFAVIPRAGHLAPLENPNCVNDLLIGFLSRVN
jgi:pimeloyl-ACP methyl ester carboxylesterase